MLGMRWITVAGGQVTRYTSTENLYTNCALARGTIKSSLLR